MSILQRKGRLLTIEINDERIDSLIAKHIRICESLITDLETALKSDDYPQKDEDIADLRRKLEEILEEAKVLKEDVNTIRLTEMQQKNYVKLNDEQYLIDKIDQLDKILMALRDLIELLRENPSGKELVHGLMEQVYDRMNQLIDHFNRLKTDDDRLKELYERVNR